MVLKRNLVLTSPYMKGDDVLMVQEALGVFQDGVFGPETAGAAKQRKYELGMKDSQVRANLTTGEWPYISGEKKPGAFMLMNQAKRTPVPQPTPVRAVDRMLTWAEKGYKEAPAGSNVVTPLASLAGATGLSSWYQDMGWPWCAFAVFLAARAEDPKVGAQAAGFAGKFNVLYVPNILTQAEDGLHGLRVVPRKEVQRGDLLVFNWDGGVPDHIGRFVTHGVNGPATVEGNTSYSDSGSQSNGGAVARRERRWSQVQAVIRED